MSGTKARSKTDSGHDGDSGDDDSGDDDSGDDDSGDDGAERTLPRRSRGKGDSGDDGAERTLPRRSRGKMTLPGAVLWDMDGTLIDTEPYWIAEERALVESVGGVWTHEHALALVGNDLMVSARYIIEHSSITMTPLEVVDHLLSKVVARVHEHVPWRPGARELLDALVAAGVPCALVTMSWRRLADVLLDSLPQDIFAAVITGDEVDHGKPHPEPYRAASRALGVPLSECLAIEDSPPGVASAVAAGVRTLAVPHAVPVPETVGAVQVASLVGFAPRDLLAAFG